MVRGPGETGQLPFSPKPENLYMLPVWGLGCGSFELDRGIHAILPGALMSLVSSSRSPRGVHLPKSPTSIFCLQSHATSDYLLFLFAF